MQMIEPILHPDPQCHRPAGTCPSCGALVYPPSQRCIRCERGAV